MADQNEFECKPVGDFDFAAKKPRNRAKSFHKDPEIPCQEHAANTCCLTADAKRIWSLVNQIDWV